MQDLKIAALEIKVDGLYSKLEEFETSQKEFNSNLQSDVQKIARGLYGDEHNQSKGMINRLVDLEERVKDLEKTNKVDEIKDNTLGKLFSAVWKTTAIIVMVWLTFKQVIGVDVLLGLIK